MSVSVTTAACGVLSRRTAGALLLVSFRRTNIPVDVAHRRRKVSVSLLNLHSSNCPLGVGAVSTGAKMAANPSVSANIKQKICHHWDGNICWMEQKYPVMLSWLKTQKVCSFSTTLRVVLVTLEQQPCTADLSQQTPGGGLSSLVFH